MKKLKSSNKIAIFLSEIPDTIYIVSFILGNVVIIASRIISVICNKSKISKSCWDIILYVVSYIIEAGIASEIIVIIIGFLYWMFSRKKE